MIPQNPSSAQARPWTIAAQSYTVLDPDTKEPAFTLIFTVDNAQANVSRLRMVPTEPRAAALEIEFAGGGYVIGSPMRQPRWLKAWERPDPNLYLDDEKAAEEYHDNLPDDQREAWKKKRQSYIKRRKEFGASADDVSRGGVNAEPDNTDPNSPEAQALRAKQAGVEVTHPADEDRKGMASQPPGGQAGETAKAAAMSQPNAPNAVDQQRQRQGLPVKQPGVPAEEIAE